MLTTLELIRAIRLELAQADLIYVPKAEFKEWLDQWSYNNCVEVYLTEYGFSMEFPKQCLHNLGVFILKIDWNMTTSQKRDYLFDQLIAQILSDEKYKTDFERLL